MSSETPVRAVRHGVCRRRTQPGGYPPAPDRKGDVIQGLDPAARHEGVVVFHSGTAAADGNVVVNGGRVLTVTAVGAGVGARARPGVRAAAEISWPGVHYRRDIGSQALP